MTVDEVLALIKKRHPADIAAIAHLAGYQAMLQQQETNNQILNQNFVNQLNHSAIEYKIVNDYLMHHGIEGQKWGVRHGPPYPLDRQKEVTGRNSNNSKSQKKAKDEWGVRKLDVDKNGDLSLKKGTIVKRISLSKADPTYDNKKYVSINQEDHSQWSSYMGEGYIKRNLTTYEQTYILNKDLKIMSSEKQGKLYLEMMEDDVNFYNSSVLDASEVIQEMGPMNGDILHPTVAEASELISRNIALQTDTAKRFIKRVEDLKYDAVFDTHGTNTAKLPIIVFNPDENMTKYKEPEYSEPVKQFFKKYYGMVY